MPNGGKRPWFICSVKKNGVSCRRRVGVLYLPPDATLFACRHCYELAYKSQQEWINPKIRAVIKSWKLIEELDRMLASGAVTPRKFSQKISKHSKLYKNLRKAGILPHIHEDGHIIR
jgi:hypothetical protein